MNQLDAFAYIAGVILSLILGAAPIISKKFDQLYDGQKRLVVIGVLALTGAVIFGLSCAGFMAILLPMLAVSCDTLGALTLVKLIVEVMISSQGTYVLAFMGKGKDTSKGLLPPPPPAE